MDATALTLASPMIQIHAYGAIAALVVGTIVLLLRKGTGLHKLLGRIWIGLMLIVSLSSFFINEGQMLGPFSWIHALSIATLFGLVSGYAAIRRGNVAAHRANMVIVYVSGLILAGAFTLLPGRRMHAVIFADGGQTAALSAAFIAFLVGATLVGRRLARA